MTRAIWSGRVFQPLLEDHPLVVGEEVCAYSRKAFYTGARVVLVPLEEPEEEFGSVVAVPVLASEYLSGKRFVIGGEMREVERIKDGDASPYPVLTTDGEQWTLATCGWD